MATPFQIKQALAVLVAAYPSADKMDRETMRHFLGILEKTLAPYPPQVLIEMVHPRTGIIASAKFFPSLAEVKAWCDKRWDSVAPRIHDDERSELARLRGPSEEAITAYEQERRKANLQKFADLLRELRAASAMQPGIR
jgi:hypothetical protein